MQTPEVARQSYSQPVLCPKCHEPARHLDASSEYASADYYRCNTCALVFTIPKFGRYRAIHYVTPEGSN